jgi:hypothetical protein
VRPLREGGERRLIVYCHVERIRQSGSDREISKYFRKQ